MIHKTDTTKGLQIPKGAIGVYMYIHELHFPKMIA